METDRPALVFATTSTSHHHRRTRSAAAATTTRKRPHLPNPTLSPPSISSKKSKQLLQHALDGSDDVSISRVVTAATVKDLRSRRVFSSPVAAAASISADRSDGCDDDDVTMKPIPCDVAQTAEVALPPEDGAGVIAAGDNLDQGIKHMEDVDAANVIVCSNDVKDLGPPKKLAFESRVPKVYQVPGSFSYRRLLPFLENMAKDDSYSFSSPPCLSKTAKAFDDSHNLNGQKPKSLVVMRNFSSPEDEDESPYSAGSKSSENGETKSIDTELSCENQSSEQINFSGNEGDSQLHIKDQKRNEDKGSSNGFAGSTEDHVASEIDKIPLDVSFGTQKCNGTRRKLSIVPDSSVPEVKDEGRCPSGLHSLNDGKIILKPHSPSKALISEELNLFGTEEITESHMWEQKSNENGGISNGVPNFNEENIQTTPPDIMDVFREPAVNMVEKDGNDLLIHTSGKMTKSTPIVDDGFACETGSVFKNNVMLNPCSRRKIFKTPGSFSYRRLLPYLMEVHNDNSDNSPEALKQTQHSKTNSDFEKKKQNLHIPIVDPNGQQTPIDKSEAGYSNAPDKLTDLKQDPPTAVPSLSDDPSDNKQLSAEKCIESQKPLYSENECMLPLQLDNASENLKASEHASCGTKPTETVCLDKNKCILPKEKDKSNSHESSERVFSGENFKSGITSPAKLSCSSGDGDTSHGDDTRKVSHGASPLGQDKEFTHSQVETFVPSGSTGDISNGILRRNPRGCRGLCNCLNCTSFRLHADRAFEFSRNQMQDAEELALDLIKELSCLRNMLKESSTSSCVHAPANIDEVMDACTKALKVEEFAKCRLKEMNSDLSVHCRSKGLERPRVGFANHVKELVVPEVDFPAGRRKLRRVR